MNLGEFTAEESRQLLRAARLQQWVDEKRERCSFGHLESAISKLEAWREINDARSKA